MNALQVKPKLIEKDLPNFITVDRKAGLLWKRIGSIFDNFEDFKENCKYEKIYPAGYVYFILLDNGRIKFGSTLDPIKRISSHQRNSRLYKGDSLIHEIFISEPLCNYREVEADIRYNLADNSLELIEDFNFYESVYHLEEVRLDQNLEYHFNAIRLKEIEKDLSFLKNVIDKPDMLKSFLCEAEVSKIQRRQDENYKVTNPKYFSHPKHELKVSYPLKKEYCLQ